MGAARIAPERGFTMIELIIGMVLLAIAIGMVGSAIVQGLSGAGTSTSGAASDAAVSRVVARFQDDVAVIETRDRAERLVREQVVLDTALRTGGTAPSDDPTAPAGTTVDLEDVLVATPSLVRFQADVDRTRAGAECVTWEVVSSGNELQVVRTVRGQGCGGAAETEVLLGARSDAAGAVPNPFSYLLMCNRTLCGPDSQAPNAQPCATWPASSVGDVKRKRWIVAVRAQFVANMGVNATKGASGTAMTIRSRDEHMWRTGLGC